MSESFDLHRKEKEGQKATQEKEPTGSLESQQDPKGTSKSIQTSPSSQTGKLNYKQKFRSKALSALTNVKDTEIENFSTSEPSYATSSEARDFDVYNDPVTQANIVVFLRKSSLIVLLQLLLEMMWIAGICSNKLVFLELYFDTPALSVVAVLGVFLTLLSLKLFPRIAESWTVQLICLLLLTASIAYLLGWVAYWVGLADLMVSMTLAFFFIMGLILYCKSSSSEEEFSIKKSILWSSLVLGGVAAIFLLTLQSIMSYWTIICSALISEMFGITLIIKAANLLSAEASGTKMRHFICFSMKYYLEVTGIVIDLLKVLLAMTRKKSGPQTTREDPTDPDGMFKFTAPKVDETKEQ